MLQRELRATSVIDSEARVVNDNAQLGSALLGVLFSAAGAQNDVDPWRGASRGQQAGTEMADGIRLGQLQEVLRKHESEIEGFKNEEAAFGAELIQLEQKLRFRYPRFFSHG